MCTPSPFLLLGCASLKIVSNIKINIIRHDHQWPSISKNPSPRISRVLQNPREFKTYWRQTMHWDIKKSTTEHPTLDSSPETLGSSPEMIYDKHKWQYWNYWSPWWLNPSTSFTLGLRLPYNYTPPQMQAGKGLRVVPDLAKANNQFSNFDKIFKWIEMFYFELNLWRYPRPQWAW